MQREPGGPGQRNQPSSLERTPLGPDGEPNWGKTQDSGDSGCQIVVVPGAAKFVLPLRILKIKNFQTFLKIARISKNTRQRRFWVPNCCRPGDGEIRLTPADFENAKILMLQRKIANFVNLNLARPLGAKLLPSRRRRNSSYPCGF